MKCSKCGKEIESVNLSMFNNYNGLDYDLEFLFKECYQDAVVIETNKSFAGYELDNEEIIDCIHCPHCGKYPFDEKLEIQLDEVLRVVCFKKDEEAHD